jgi:hypothetical protein
MEQARRLTLWIRNRCCPAAGAVEAMLQAGSRVSEYLEWIKTDFKQLFDESELLRRPILLKPAEQ